MVPMPYCTDSFLEVSILTHNPQERLQNHHYLPCRTNKSRRVEVESRLKPTGHQGNILISTNFQKSTHFVSLSNEVNIASRID